MPGPINIIKKVCLLGDPGVGKTSLTQRYVFDVFSDAYVPTIGTKVVKKRLIMDFVPPRPQQANLTMLIWDLLGETRFQELHKTYFQGTEGALVVCDITRKETTRSIRDWLDKLYSVVGTIPVAFLCNKIDLKELDGTEKNDIASIAHDLGDLPYFFTSAKTGQNVETAFFTLAEAMLRGLPY